MIKIELFRVFFTFGYLNTNLVPETNNILRDTLDLGEFMRWVNCWLYMDFGVGIPDRHDWCSVTPLVMNRGYPFYLY